MIKDLTKEEIDSASAKIKHLTGLDFNYKNGDSRYIFCFTEQPNLWPSEDSIRISNEVLHRKNELYNWNLEVTIKIVNLRNTYIYLWSFVVRTKKPEHSGDKFYSWYFCELIAYFFVSAIECIYQLINVYLDLGLSETAVSKKNILERLGKRSDSYSEEIINCVKKLEKNIDDYRKNYRNPFTHRSNPLVPKYETVLEENKSLRITPPFPMHVEQFCDKTLEAFEFLSEYIEELRLIICKTTIDRDDSISK